MKLKPCPFCGGEARFTAKVVYKHVLYYVQCKDCGVMNEPYMVEQGKIAVKYEKNPAIKAWNRRKPIDDIVEQLEKESKEVFAIYMKEGKEYYDGWSEALDEAIEIVKGETK